MPIRSDDNQEKGHEIQLVNDLQECQDILMNAPVGFFRSTPDGRFLAVNPALAQMYGFSDPEEFIHSSTEDGVQFYAHPDDRIEFYRLLEQDGKVVNYECRARRKDGSPLWVSTNARAIRDTAGNVAQIQGYSTDVTEHKQAEESLRESEERFRTVLECLPGGIFTHDLNGHFLLVNKAACQNTGYSRQELLHMVVEDIDPHVVTRDDRTNLWQEMEKGKSLMIESTHIRKDGSQYPAEIYMNAITLDRQPVILAVAFDISQRKQAEEALAHSHSLMRYIIEHANSAVAVHDQDLRYIYVSQSYLNQFQVKEKEVIGKHHYEIFPELPQKWRDAHQRALKGEISRADRDAYYGPDGSLGWTRWECLPWYDVDDSIGGFIVYTEIITDRVRDEKAKAEQKALLEAIYRNAPLVLMLVDNACRIQQINGYATYFADLPAEQMLGLHAGEALMCLHALDHPKGCGFGEYCQSCVIRNTVIDTLEFGSSHLQVEAPYLYWNGGGSWELTLLVSTTPVLFGNSRMALVTIQDITERKMYEQQLHYLSLHDQLTGLYNRAYLETELERLNRSREYPTNVIYMDLDGLKLVNDSMGHQHGDRQLTACAQILRDSFRSSDIVARMGGDEFTALLPRTDLEGGEQIVKRIRAQVESYNREYMAKIPLSLSIGLACAEHEGQDLNQVLKKAEDLMYQDKLTRNLNSRSQIIKALLAALEERDYITSGHAHRLRELCEKLGRKINLSSSKLSSLNLLARVHDLGKVGIPDHILFKPGPLTADEWKIMCQHPEKGYRIAQETTDLAGIADLILKHHERWDGQGYPLGLSGNDIPIECRILAIADAFDTMTNDRPFRRAVSSQEALQELKKCAGSQFDPELVKAFLELCK